MRVPVHMPLGRIGLRWLGLGQAPVSYTYKGPWIIIVVTDNEGKPVPGVQVASVVPEVPTEVTPWTPSTPASTPPPKVIQHFFDVATTNEKGKAVLFALKSDAATNRPVVIRPMLAPIGYSNAFRPYKGPRVIVGRDVIVQVPYYPTPPASDFLEYQRRNTVIDQCAQVGFTVDKIKEIPLPEPPKTTSDFGVVSFRVLAGPDIPIGGGFAYKYTFSSGFEGDSATFTNTATTDEGGILTLFYQNAIYGRAGGLAFLDLAPVIEGQERWDWGFKHRPVMLQKFPAPYVYNIFHSHQLEQGLPPALPPLTPEVLKETYPVAAPTAPAPSCAPTPTPTPPVQKEPGAKPAPGTEPKPPPEAAKKEIPPIIWGLLAALGLGGLVYWIMSSSPAAPARIETPRRRPGRPALKRA